MRSVPVLAIAMVLQLASESTARAGVLYGLDSRFGNLVTINPSDGNILSSLRLGSTEFRGIAANSSGNLFGVTVGSNAQLFQIDPITAGITPIGALGVSSVSGLTFSGDTLYGVDLSSRLLSINTSNGSASIVSSLSGSPFSTGLAFGQGALFVADSLADTLVRIDNGVATTVGPLGSPSVNALAFDGNGTLFGVDSFTGNLLTINTSTGRASAVGNVGGLPIQGITFLQKNTPVVPEPSSVAIWGSVLLGAGLLRRSRRNAL